MNLKKDILEELSHLHKYGNITTSPSSKNESPIFAKRKSDGKLRLEVNPQKKPIPS